jgi:hypothetical protein
MALRPRLVGPLAHAVPAGLTASWGYEAQLNKVRALVSYRSKVLRNQVRTQRMRLVTLHLRGAD